MKHLFVLIILILHLNPARAQISWDPSFEDMKAQVKEKTILITDRNLYLTGEDLRFTVYNIVNDTITNPDLSKIIYIEVFNSQKTFIKRKIELIDDMANGVIEIPSDLQSDNYYIRAYTYYQRNQKPESFFTKAIQIINPSISLPTLELSAEEHILTSVYSGNFYSGDSVSFVYHIHPYLLSQAIKVQLINQNDSTIADLLPFENGLGEFKFKSEQDFQYSISLQFKDGSIFQKSLNPTKTFALQIKEYSNKDILRFNIGLGDQVLISDSDTLQMSIISPSFQLLGETKFTLKSGMASIQIAQSIFENGINYVLVKDQNDSILINHPIFRNLKNPEIIAIEMNQKIYAPRDKIDLTLNLPHEINSKAIVLNMAVVKKRRLFQKQNLPLAILANPILLNSWMILNENLAAVENQIDLLMHLFESELANHQYDYLFEKDSTQDLFWLPETRGLSLSGLIMDKKTKEPQENIPLIASVLGNNDQIHFARTKPDGSFLFLFYNLTGMHPLALSIDNYQSGKMEIMVNNDFAELPFLNNIPIWTSPQELNFIEELYFNQQTQLAFGNTTTINLQKDEPQTQLWIPDTTIYLKDYIRSESMEQLIDEIIPFVNARETEGEYSIVIQDKEVLSTYSSPFILLDNYPVKNVNELLKLNPSLINKVSIIYSPYQSGVMRLNGLISFFTDSDNFAGYPTDTNSVFLNFQTSTLFKKEVFPTYDEKQISSEADFRNLLFWKPNITYQEDKHISFYASDYCSEYDIIIKGISGEGKFITGETTLVIKN